MLILQASNLIKSFGDKEIFRLTELEIHQGQKIGLVGANGAGKTTLLEILAGRIQPDEGTVRLLGSLTYLGQFTGETDTASGGEQSKHRLAQALQKGTSLLLADEPTANMDMEGIREAEEKLVAYPGALLLVTHDRGLLSQVCGSVLELENGRITHYNCDYDTYREEKKKEVLRAGHEYKQYLQEKERLRAAIAENRAKTERIRKAPSRMGNSEARLHKRAAGEVKSKLARATKNLETRLMKLEQKAPPPKEPLIRLEADAVNCITAKTALSCRGKSLQAGERRLLGEWSFELPRGSKTALIGNNGTGKTTLLRLLVKGGEGIKYAPGIIPGYFSQALDILDYEKTVLENARKDSAYEEDKVRIVLARLLFKRDDVYKKAAVLSGGERVKLSLARLFLSSANLLILDEPTNYLDLWTIEAVQDALAGYGGTVIFASHDRRFVEKAADRIIYLEQGQLRVFPHGYPEYQSYLERRDRRTQESVSQEALLVKMRLAELGGMLAERPPKKGINKEQLEKEYLELAARLRTLSEH